SIIAFAVRSFSGGDVPSTTQPGWTAETLTAALWLQPMGGADSTLPSWAAYTGISYTDAFPEDPAEANAYVTAPGSPDVIAAGDSLDGFFFQGAPSTLQLGGGVNETDRFLAVKDHGNVPIGQPIIASRTTVSGSVEVVPEPSSLNLCLLAAAVLGIANLFKVNCRRIRTA
ncbi:MAG TPA: PEP-CTERM sorting domain-containing protein, partial [Candidatus Saccharimonadales bacterium]|nr:PEP-CTERM sorting domain-containing protein [Candidatus Saccharimonadales bacterium]